MTETAPENTVLTAAVEAYAKPDAAEWLAFMAEHSADITPMYQQIDVNDDKDDGADARASQRKRKRAAALTDETAPLEGLKASITPPLIDVLRIVQQANLGMSPSIRGHAEHGGHVLREYLTPREYDLFERTGMSPTERRPCLLCMRSQIHYAHMCMVHNMQDMPNSGILLNSIDQSALRYRPEDRMRLHNAPAAGQLF
ncbi:hypothetical protein CYMTET_8286 [Cymbomonas tetramitiformis]|uniref:Uncharacterized protein n=1 Tax=Cymbomonas tetramitiformis TaxID=36881 RepID=A0AAE0GTY8_9CHLO|nr:hypothetical protein CYMTET_8286 [Cymbomonas tetramitiformis]